TSTIKYGETLVVNTANNQVTISGKPVEILGKEFDLLLYFLQNRNVILPKEQIFDRIWGFDSDTTVTVVEVYMSKLRKKLKGTEFVENLATLRNVGYILR
ncbi:MAG: winged helix-turn-helix domain-containing protein, partial [Lactococcus raffinolactis]